MLTRCPRSARTTVWWWRFETARGMTRWPIAGGVAWLLAICASRVGVYMVYIAFAATLPVLEREWHLSGTAAGSIATAFQVAYALSLMVVL